MSNLRFAYVKDKIDRETAQYQIVKEISYDRGNTLFHWEAEIEVCANSGEDEGDRLAYKNTYLFTLWGAKFWLWKNTRKVLKQARKRQYRYEKKEYR